MNVQAVCRPHPVCSLFTVHCIYFSPGHKAAVACDQLIVEYNRNEDVLQELNISHYMCMKDLVCRICAGTMGVKQQGV
jgi:hypothetical protein